MALRPVLHAAAASCRRSKRPHSRSVGRDECLPSKTFRVRSDCECKHGKVTPAILGREVAGGPTSALQRQSTVQTLSCGVESNLLWRIKCVLSLLVRFSPPASLLRARRSLPPFLGPAWRRRRSRWLLRSGSARRGGGPISIGCATATIITAGGTAVTIMATIITARAAIIRGGTARGEPGIDANAC